MRRSLLGLLTVVAIAGLLATTGCERTSTLRVASINGGNTLESDVADWAIWTDPTDPEATPELVYAFAADSAEVVLQYVEIGAGFPTWTPYEALINKVTITYKGTSEDAPVYEPAVTSVTQSVIADPTNKKTTKFYMTVVPASWKQTYFGDAVLDPPNYDVIDFVDAKVEVSGWDSVASRPVKAAGKLQIEFGNFPDNERSFGD